MIGARSERRRASITGLVLAGGLALAAGVQLGQAQGRQLDATAELVLKITEPFTVASVGDLILFEPLSAYGDPALQNALKVIRDADIGIGNMETNIVDRDQFDGPLRNFAAAKAAAADVKAMGFDLLNRANNHTFDSGPEGMFATQALLEAEGLVYAGTGRTLEEARAARFLQTPKGRVGVVGMQSGDAASAATYRLNSTGGRPGLNPLRVSRQIIVTPEQLAALQRVRDAVYADAVRGGTTGLAPLPANASGDPLQLFGTSYKAGSTPGRLSYTMNQNDLRDIVRSIRNGKQYADFLIATIHAHESASAFQSTIFSGNAEEPPDFLIELAHQAVDNGADAFVGHGPHVLRGVEIYKGKPIFYGLGQFVRQIQMSIADLTRYEEAGLNPFATDRTQAELIYGWRSGRRMMEPENFEGLIAESRFDEGRLVEVRLHPTIAGHDAPLSRMGIPRVPPPDVARLMLEKLQRLSRPFGTTIGVEGNVGVIRVPASPTSGGQPRP